MAQRSGFTALITGASAGMGHDYAHLFAADGHDVVLVARRQERLDTLADELTDAHGIQARPLAADLIQADAAQQIYDQLRADDINVDFLVNNAGFGSNGAFSELDGQREIDMIAVNITALTQLTRLFLPGMIERGHGRILNVGSTAGFQAGPFMATYYASKAYVNHFSEALAHEVKGTGVTVTVSCPGPVATEFSAIAGNDKSNLFASAAAASQDIAGEAYRAMMKGRRMVVHGARNKMLVQALRLAPRGAIHSIAAHLNQKAK